MSASKRASETIHDDLLLECVSEKHLPQDVCVKMAAVIAAEYAPLIKAAKLVKRYRKTVPFTASDIEAIQDAWNSLDKVLAHIEGDATP